MNIEKLSKIQIQSKQVSAFTHNQPTIKQDLFE